MEFPTFFNTLTIPSGAGAGTSRIVITANGELISFGDPPDASGDFFISLKNGGLWFGLQNPVGTADYTHAGAVGLSFAAGHATVTLQSPFDATAPNATAIQLIPGVDASGLGQVVFSSVNNVQQVFGVINGFWIYINETWHAAVAAANWNVVSLQYRIDASDNLVYSGRIDYTGANVTAAGASFATAAVDVAHRPINSQTVPLVHRTSAGVMKNVAASGMLNTTGTVSIFWGDGIAGTTHDVNGLATGDQFYFNCVVPRGIIA